MRCNSHDDLLHIQGRMQGAATAANAVPRNGSHSFLDLNFRF